MSAYTDKLNELCDLANSMSGTAGARTIRKVVGDLEGNGPIGELLHATDRDLFTKLINLLIEFRNTGRMEAFNSIHADAREKLGLNNTEEG